MVLPDPKLFKILWSRALQQNGVYFGEGRLLTLFFPQKFNSDIVTTDMQKVGKPSLPGAEGPMGCSLRTLENAHRITCKVVHGTRTIASANSFSFLMFYTDDPFSFHKLPVSSTF